MVMDIDIDIDVDIVIGVDIFRFDILHIYLYIKLYPTLFQKNITSYYLTIYQYKCLHILPT